MSLISCDSGIPYWPESPNNFRSLILPSLPHFRTQVAPTPPMRSPISFTNTNLSGDETGSCCSCSWCCTGSDEAFGLDFLLRFFRRFLFDIFNLPAIYGRPCSTEIEEKTDLPRSIHINGFPISIKYESIISKPDHLGHGF